MENIDSIVMRIGVDWLTQYARFLRKSPETVARLQERTGEFDMIPFPRELLDRLAVPGLVGSGRLGSAVDVGTDALLQLRLQPGPSLPLAKGPPVPMPGISTSQRDAGNDSPLQRIRDFAQAMEGGDLSALRELISPSFLDAEGRRSEDILGALKVLIEQTAARRLFILRSVETEWSETAVRGQVELIWDVQLDPAGLEYKTERILLVTELHLVAGRWRILDLRAS